ncbi:MAG TPA: acyl carrier protein [Actinomycetota bacterium]|nr:acyl carrier protein [Actinomycetota bacterium]
MAKEQIFEALKEVLSVRLRVQEDLIKPEATLAEDLGLDSIDMMTAVMAIEEKFGIEVSDSEVETIVTLNDAVELLAAKAPAGV